MLLLLVYFVSHPYPVYILSLSFLNMTSESHTLADHECSNQPHSTDGSFTPHSGSSPPFGLPPEPGLPPTSGSQPYYSIG